MRWSARPREERAHERVDHVHARVALLDEDVSPLHEVDFTVHRGGDPVTHRDERAHRRGDLLLKPLEPAHGPDFLLDDGADRVRRRLSRSRRGDRVPVTRGDPVRRSPLPPRGGGDHARERDGALDGAPTAFANRTIRSAKGAITFVMMFHPLRNPFHAWCIRFHEKCVTGASGGVTTASG